MVGLSEVVDFGILERDFEGDFAVFVDLAGDRRMVGLMVWCCWWFGCLLTMEYLHIYLLNKRF